MSPGGNVSGLDVGDDIIAPRVPESSTDCCGFIQRGEMSPTAHNLPLGRDGSCNGRTRALLLGGLAWKLVLLTDVEMGTGARSYRGPFVGERQSWS